MFLIIIIGLALFAFVLDPSTIGDFFNSSKVNTVGEVNGEEISRKEFTEAIEEYKADSGNRFTEMQSAKAVWENLVNQKLYKSELKKTGITIGEEDLLNEMSNIQSVKTNPQFLNELGVFDIEKLKVFLKDTKENNPQLWANWSQYMSRISDNLQRNTYTNLVSGGIGASLKEGEAQFLSENTKIDARFVYIPFSSVPDSLVKVTKKEIASYVKEHASEFEVEDSRDIRYVNFLIKPTKEDEEAISKEVALLLEDREEYSKVSKSNITIAGLKNTNDISTFLNDNDSDIDLDNEVKFKNEVPAIISEAVFAGSKGDVFGPYKDKEFFKISKITEVKELPDSAKASHILIPFKGASRAAPDVEKTEEQAKKFADSLLTIVKKNKAKFADFAKEFSSDKSNSDKGGDLKWFNYRRMTPKFRDFVFEGKKGDLGVVKTPFGFHIIKIDDQKNKQKVVKLGTFGRKIEASEATETSIYQEAETFAFELSKGKKFDELVKETKLSSQPAIGLKVLDENVPGIGNERQIVSWSFNRDTKIGDSKRFDTEKGHAVVLLMNKTPKGLMPVNKANSKVYPILLNKKKAALIKDKMVGDTVEAIAKANKTTVRTASAVTLKSPALSGVGNEPNIIGAMTFAKENELVNKVKGTKGVFAFKVIKRELPTALPNYDSYRQRMADQRRRQTFKMFQALKESAKIEDNRAFYYGIQ